MGEQGSLGQWLANRCQREHLSLRQVAARTGLSHVTIADVIKGKRPLPETLRKLVHGFGGDGELMLALEDHLLTLAGYRTPRAGEKLSISHATLMDKVSKFSEPQLEMMTRFADFLIEMERRD